MRLEMLLRDSQRMKATPVQAASIRSITGRFKWFTGFALTFNTAVNFT